MELDDIVNQNETAGQFHFFKLLPFIQILFLILLMMLLLMMMMMTYQNHPTYLVDVKGATVDLEGLDPLYFLLPPIRIISVMKN